MLLSLSISGVPFVGADVGGFFGNPDEQLLTRWYEAAAFQPFFRAHAHIDTKRREPWLFSRPTMEAIRQAIRRRYALLPYWYALFREHALTGAPPMRPIWFEFPKEQKFFDYEKAWMVGNALLVHPVVEKDTYSVNVDLPAGEQSVSSCSM
ncbi:unnamed protein product [Cylicostephanus goldi]|uniref:Glycoside hydrolase family 31 N-terminal domain-containing protein n=1 Tax=Cylicostephanus goldi TaxID=71465 RepID=A0A3P6QY75_CYLGO|nr:unnamed protein product [Cylicostephanus goldi]